MAIIKTTIDGVDHLDTGEHANVTVCGLDIPYEATWDYAPRMSTSSPCPKCFPDEIKAAKAEKKAAKASA